MSTPVRSPAPPAADRQALFEALLAAEGIAAPQTGPRAGAGGERAPLSLAQERLWFLHRLDPGSAAYNIPLALRLKGTLDREALARALGEIARRHHALRTRFEEHDGEAVQVVSEWAPLPLPVHECAGCGPEELRRWMAAQAGAPFDLRRDLPFRAALLRVADDDHVFAATLHHIVGDAWSAGVLLRELAALYGAFARGLPAPLPEPPLQYADFAVWQRERLDGEAAAPLLEYWRDHLAGAPPLMRLPADRPRPEVQGREGGIVTRSLGGELPARLQAVARECGATLFAVLLAGFKALLARHGAGDDVVVGTPVAGRDDAELEGLIGFFINTLALRTGLGGDPPFRELVRRVQATSLGAFAHQELPFERLVEALQVERTLSFAPVFQVAFSLQNTPRGGFRLPGLEVHSVEAEAHHAKFDLFLSAAEGASSLRLSLEYSSELFDEA
ncbi:MAG TPA: condensation domain-containing protein, partial [Longimicrobium sp.]|nr:condensation domain-containing protein [Longimicrobium sp.]